MIMSSIFTFKGLSFVLYDTTSLLHFGIVDIHTNGATILLSCSAVLRAEERIEDM